MRSRFLSILLLVFTSVAFIVPALALDPKDAIAAIIPKKKQLEAEIAYLNGVNAELANQIYKIGMQWSNGEIPTLKLWRERIDPKVQEQNDNTKKIKALQVKLDAQIELIRTLEEDLQAQISRMNDNIAAMEDKTSKAKDILGRAEALPLDNPERASTIELAESKIAKFERAAKSLRSQRDLLAKPLPGQ